MKKTAVIVCLVLLAFYGQAQDINEQEMAKEMAMNALKKRGDILAGVGTSYINIKGDGLKNSSGIKALNYNYFLGGSGYDQVLDTDAFTMLEFTAGKMKAYMPGHASDSLTIFNAKSMDSWYLTAKVAMGYQLITKKAFYVALETGPYFDLLAKTTLEGHAGTEEDYFTYKDDFRSFNWGWSIGATASFRSYFVNWSMGSTIKDYSKVSGKTMTIPFQTRFIVGVRFSSEYGEADASMIENLTGK